VKKGFTLFELLIVMVVVGILSSTAYFSLRINRDYFELEALYLNLLKAKYQAINYDKRGVETNLSIGCVKVERSLICFDRFGRAYKNGKPITNPTFIATFKNRSLLLFPQTGYLKVVSGRSRN